MKLCWIIPRSDDYTDYNRALASVWIRCLQLIEPLRAMGYESMVNEPKADADIAIFFRVQDRRTQALLKKMKKRGIKTVFIAGINYYERTGNVERIKASVLDHQIVECIRMTELADMVIVSSRFLLDRAQRYNDNAHYIPDSVSRDHFRLAKSKQDFLKPSLNLRWAGHAAKASLINGIAGAIEGLPVTLTVIAEKPPQLSVPYEFVNWQYETFPDVIAAGDICISPRILDNSYDQGHSNFKIMVFLAQGVPALVSPQDSYVEVVRDHFNGFVCRDLRGWRQRLSYLVEHREVFGEMSRNAIASAQPYLTASVLSRYHELFSALASSPQRPTPRKSILDAVLSRVSFRR